MAYGTVRYTEMEVFGHTIAAMAANEHLSGIPVVFLHGFAGSMRFWEPNLPRHVKQNRRWYSISLPGHYPSRWQSRGAAKEISQDALADVLSAAIAQLVDDLPVGIVGWSTGGFLALNIAALRPEMVASVLSISGFSCGRWDGFLGAVQRLARCHRTGRRLAVGALKLATRHKRLFRTSLRAHAKSVDTNRRQKVLNRTVDAMFQDIRNHDTGLLADLAVAIHDFDLGARLEKIRCPTMVAGGDSDPIIPLERTIDLAKQIPQSELVCFTNTGHLFFAECTDSYYARLDHWLLDLDHSAQVSVATTVSPEDGMKPPVALLHALANKKQGIGVRTSI